MGVRSCTQAQGFGVAMPTYLIPLLGLVPPLGLYFYARYLGWRDRKTERDPVHRLTPDEILERMEAIAKEFHVPLDEALAKLRRGELSGTWLEPELHMYCNMLGAPQRIVVDAETFEMIRKAIENPQPPNERLRALFRNRK